MISSGVREVIRYLVQHKHVDVLVTTGGGIEEDLMKCLAPHKMGDFALRGKDLRPKGLNRIGNLLVPNDTYCKFEDWLRPILWAAASRISAHSVASMAWRWHAVDAPFRAGTRCTTKSTPRQTPTTPSTGLPQA